MPKKPPTLEPIDQPSTVSGMGTVSRATLGDRVYERVRDAIIRGELAAGTEINQVELASSLGVSRVPVREALRRLQAERLLDANPFQRFVVTKLSQEQVLELFDLRQELEVFAALRARSRPTFLDADLPAAREIAKAMNLSMSAEEWLQADMEFHRTLNGRDSAVSSIIDEVRFRIYRYVHLAAPDLPRRKQVLVEHQTILKAVEHGDEDEIRTVIEAHVGHTRDRLVSMAWAT
ncbi:GntR family transcriptional regulator [Phytohabitans rumicis]|uniref:GntR family transcriptional regulator n=1 Tax=Phytohabitans rumicis TaxID=1076125 RepID=A0A6V8LQV9_9ACTN|nr:GntR family transcriptional regulator [Phytohabitans rumicis]GFJ96497.1 GntR family transcriptional regulator [Phytohabitans rumicis]